VAARLAVIALVSLLAGCASHPSRTVYVLSSASDPVKSDAGGATAPVLQLERVLVPDYLDTSEILLRVDQHEMRESHTGRWGERLSAGIARSLRADLADRLPKDTVLLGRSADSSALQLRVTVDTFDVWADGHCVLQASWSLEAENRGVAKKGHGTFTAPVVGGATGSDAAVVSSMANAVSQLADSIASAVKEP
jgi:uncharacterized lipoprotein YmbA